MLDDRSIIFRETLDASINKEFGFQEKDILPLFLKYQSKRQILIDTFSFFTYILQLPTQLHLRRLQNSNFMPKKRDRWFKTMRKADDGSSLL